MFLTTLLSFALSASAASTPKFARQNTNAPTRYAVQTPPLDTDWTYQVGTNPWPQYPRPKLVREEWQSLNGLWTYSNATSLDAVNDPPFNQTLPRQVLVPFCLESALSGIQETRLLYSWYQTHFTIPSNWTGERILLNFDAVDYEATVFVNGQNATFHRGGYFAFSVDVTGYIDRGGSNELIVFVHDPTDSGDYVIPIGKQSLHPSHIFYRPCSGIWQSVWLEAAPANYITSLNINGDASGNLNMTVDAAQSNLTSVDVTVKEKESGKTMGTYRGNVGMPFSFNVNSVQPWSPDSPNLYDVDIKMGEDTVRSYTGFRTVSRGEINGVQRILLNGQAFFPFGTLDQGYWPDGLYTPPTYEAMTYDIHQLKKIGYNMLRKHIKVESPLYYAAADEIGILVIQDMPALRPLQSHTFPNCTTRTVLPDPAQQQEFQRQLELLVNQFKSYTSIFTWLIYNEGWGQLTDNNYPEFALTDIVRNLDPTRLVDATSGWYDHGAGDFSDNHHYANAQCGTPFSSIASSPFDPSRIGFQGEFGGIGQNVSAEHLWKVQQAIDGINQTYEIDQTLDVWNYRGHFLLRELESQVDLYDCAGGVWTQTTDVEGEVNGMMTYDRRILRPDLPQWNADIKALYDASARRSNASTPGPGTEIPFVTATEPWPGKSTFWSKYHWTAAGPARTQGYGYTSGYSGVPGEWGPPQ
ncbi:glycoside hydrolase family 2 [Lecanosticta acicola]|uniref:Glycoside hydrolase family 2 n=1 Tax=Lecanosticta acicola TaxID=111012 RepID=A0AAI8YS30_9PEZI|nr:glycoside hydrolase family 2 [Lecanosticta acicola]